MPFFRPPPNSLDPYQLELCASAFRQAWCEIVRLRPYMSNEEKTRLQTQTSERLCAFAAAGIIDLETLRGLTVATVGLRRGIKRRSRPATLQPARII
jgi:hypothetical protein